MMTRLTLLFVCIGSMSLPALSQTETPEELILGEWNFVTNVAGYFSTITFDESGTFKSTTRREGDAPNQASGTYTIKGKQLLLNYGGDRPQVNEIEILDTGTLQFRYIETIFRYTRFNA